MAITGFVEPWTGKATERLVSCSSRGPIEAVCIRALDRDELPLVDWAVRQLASVQHRSFSQGAFLSVGDHSSVFGLAFELLLTRNPGRRVLLDAA